MLCRRLSVIDWADGFSHYGTNVANMLDGPYAAVGFMSLDATHVRTGTHALSSSNGSAEVRRVFTTSEDVHGVAIAMFLSAMPSSTSQLVTHSFRDAGNGIQIEITVWPTGQVAAYLGARDLYDNLLGVSSLDGMTPRVTANGFNHIEAWCGIDATSGWVEVRINGVTALNLTGINTDFTSSGESSIWALRGAGSSWPFELWISDLIGLNDQGATNNSFIGDKKVFEDFPDGDTADTDWTPSSGGSTWPMVDDADPDGDGTYIEADTVGDVSGMTFANIDASVVSISGIFVLHKSRKTDAGTSNVQLSIDSGIDSADGGDRPMTTVYSVYGDGFEVDPATSAPWLPAGANAMSLRITRTA
jgi:hypothetical protein